MKIFCIGRNYTEHARELGHDVPEDPVVFMKPRTALLRPHLPFYYPEFTNELHYETELVIRIAKNGRYINRRYAYQYYDAVTVGIDFTARDLQNELMHKGLPWEKAKGWDSSAIMGEWRPISNFVNRKDITFSLQKNGETVQVGNSSKMIHSFETIVAHVSKFFTLNIGDVIYTGTPAGVGEVLPGDELEGFLEGESLFKLLIE